MFDFGRSKKRNDTSDGTDIGVIPIREFCVCEVEKHLRSVCRTNDGTRNAAQFCCRWASRTNDRKGCLKPAQAMLAIGETIRSEVQIW